MKWTWWKRILAIPEKTANRKIVTKEPSSSHLIISNFTHAMSCPVICHVMFVAWYPVMSWHTVHFHVILCPSLECHLISCPKISFSVKTKTCQEMPCHVIISMACHDFVIQCHCPVTSNQAVYTRHDITFLPRLCSPPTDKVNTRFLLFWRKPWISEIIKLKN